MTNPKTSGIDLSIFPDGLRQTVERHQREFAGGRMQLEEAPAGDEQAEAQEQSEETSGDEQLGESGKKALTAERQRAKDAEKANKELTEKVSTMETKFNSLIEALTGKAPEAEVTADDAVAQLTELTNQLEQRDSQAADRARRSEIKAAATAARFSDPTDALAYVDLSKVAITEDGDVDSAAVKQLVDDLAKAKPYLVKAAPKPPSAGQVGVGSKGAGNSSVTGISRIAAALKNNK